MITGNISSVSRVSSTSGKRKATTMSSAGSPYFFSRCMLLSSPLHRRPVAEQPLRPEHQHQYQYGEDHDRRPLDAYVLVGHRPDDPDQEPPDHRSGEVADAPEDRRGEGVESLLETHIEDRDAVEEAVHHARGSSQDARQEKCDRDRAVHIDPDHRRRLLVLRDGPHRLALFGPLYEVREDDEQRYRHRDNEEILPSEDDRLRRQEVGVGDEVRKRHLGRALPHEADILEDERHADGCDQNREPWRVPQRFVCHPLYPHVEQATDDHRDDHGYDDPYYLQEGPGAVGYRAEKRKTKECAAEDRQTDEGAYHEDVAVGEVDQLYDPVDQRVAKRDERDYGPVSDPDNQLREELRGVLHRLNEQRHQQDRRDGYRDPRLPARRPDALDEVPSPGLSQFTRCHLVSSVGKGDRSYRSPLRIVITRQPKLHAILNYSISSTLRMRSSSNSPFSTLTTESSVRVVSPLSSKLQVPRTPLKSSVAKISCITSSRSTSPSSPARSMASSITLAAS